MIVKTKQLISSIFAQAEKAILEKVNLLALSRFNIFFADLIRDVETHPISKEINQKQSLSKSNFLSVDGNLFSFLGFRENQDPISDLIDFLKISIHFIPANKITVSGLIGLIKPRATLPTKSDFNILSLSWEPGRSWVNAIEEGISNLGYYLFIYSAASRSGKGIQSKYPVKPANFKTVAYMTPILENFKKRLNPDSSSGIQINL